MAQRNPPPAATSPLNRSALLRVGLIGGLVLAIAMAAQRIAIDPESASLGLVLVMGGLSIVGYFAARESGAQSRRQAAGAGAVGGLFAGVLVGLAFVAMSLLLSFQPGEFEVLQAQFQTGLTPLQQAQMKELGWDARELVRLSLTLAVSCCGVGLPATGALLGAFGGANAGQRKE